MKYKESMVRKRSIVIDGHKTSISLEDLFWAMVKTVARDQGLTVYEYVSEINQNRGHKNLSSYLRVLVTMHALTHKWNITHVREDSQEQPSPT